MCNNNGNCIAEILEKILLLQQIDNSNIVGCNKPFLGELSGINANTRPINLYCCCTGNIWTMPYNYNGTEGDSTVFRIESINDNCATFRILIANTDSYTATDNFFTINLDYISCIKCLADTLLSNI